MNFYINTGSYVSSKLFQCGEKLFASMRFIEAMLLRIFVDVIDDFL